MYQPPGHSRSKTKRHLERPAPVNQGPRTRHSRSRRRACSASRAGEARAARRGIAAQIANFQARYDTILSEDETRNPRRSRRAGPPGRVKQSPAYDLMARLRAHRDEVLRFISGLHVPCDNNLRERDIRMPKLKQKVSGCLRTEDGVEHFAIIRSYPSTLHKQSADIFQSLVLTCHGKPPDATAGGAE